jgi:hypothetical protein
MRSDHKEIPMLRPAISLFALLVVGCADQGTDDSSGTGGGGGKADDASTRTGALRLVVDEEQEGLRASDAECLHVNYTQNDTYGQAVKLFCMPRGGVAAPLVLFLAVTPLGEADGAYKVFELQEEYFSDNPESVTFRMSGTKATYSFKARQPEADEATGELVWKEHAVTASVTFSGSSEDPSIVGAYTITE